MKNTKVKIKYAIVALGMLAALLAPLGCTRDQAAFKGIRVSGTGDLGYLSILINDWASKDTTVPAVGMTASTDSIGDLKNGKSDAILLGREPTAQELQGLKDYVIAYDAVCIIIDASSNVGGVVGPASYPVGKTSGLKNLTTDDVKSLFNKGYTFDGYFEVKPNLDPDSILWKLDGGIYAWNNLPKVISSSFTFPPGRFDTQTVLYQKLGLDEKQMLAGLTAFTCPRFSVEEEVISYEYRSSDFSLEYGIHALNFKIGFASRRAMTLALEHAPVKVLSINGIDPVAQPQSIYDGSYPFSRKIHLLIRDNSSQELQNLASVLISPAGQQFIKDAGYLPVALS
jgi:hypothetical protein